METINKLESYSELKARHAKELDEFKGIFFAFDNKQFKEGMEKIGLTDKDKTKIYSLGRGGFILKDRSKSFNEMFKRHDEERTQRNKEERFLIESIVYELFNHEYCITGDIVPALDALGLEEKDIDPKILREAINKHRGINRPINR